MPEEPMEGDVVLSGTVECEWSIHVYYLNGGEDTKYGWVADRVDGNYQESDWYFDSIEEARKDLLG